MSVKRLLPRLVLLGLLNWVLLFPHSTVFLFERFSGGGEAIYVFNSLLDLTINHLSIVMMAVLASAMIAVGFGIMVTRPWGADFLPLSRSIANVGQTFPPVAVLALAVPAMGYGAWPTLAALWLYSLLPIFENTLTGLSGVPHTIREAAKSAGMTETQCLWRIELPLAMPAIISGVRVSFVIALSTAAIGSTVAAKTLGEVILAGLISNNYAYILQGAFLISALAILFNDAFVYLEQSARRRLGQT